MSREIEGLNMDNIQLLHEITVIAKSIQKGGILYHVLNSFDIDLVSI